MPTAAKTRLLVREESLDDVLPDLVRLLGATRRHAVSPERFEWLYRQNPDGEAVIWTIRSGEEGAVVGFTACLPRRLCLEGQKLTAWNGADFSIDPAHRTLGPAVKLRRAARTAIDAGRVACLYAHPNDRMAKIHERVGHRPVGTMVRLALPVRISGYLFRRWLDRLPGRLAANLADTAFRMTRSWNRVTSTIDVVPFRQPFDESFDDLFEACRPKDRIVGDRHHRYLNWRYRDNPLYESHVLVAERRGRRTGYLIWTQDTQVCHIKDLVSEDAGSATALLAAAARHAYASDRRSLSISLLDGHPLLPAFTKIGFRRRPESSRMFAYQPDRAAVADFYCASRWSITVGDRDV